MNGTCKEVEFELDDDSEMVGWLCSPCETKRYGLMDWMSQKVLVYVCDQAEPFRIVFVKAELPATGLRREDVLASKFPDGYVQREWLLLNEKEHASDLHRYIVEPALFQGCLSLPHLRWGGGSGGGKPGCNE